MTWYGATITSLNKGGGFTVKWDDDGSHIEVAASDVKKGGVVCRQGAQPPVGEPASPYCFVDDRAIAKYLGDWYVATITALNKDGSFTVKWDDDGSETDVAPSEVKKGGVVCQQAPASTEV